MKILVTGGAGFIGSNFIRYMLKKYVDIKIINLDKLTYAGNTENLKDVEKNKNYTFVRGDVRDRKIVNKLVESIDAIVHFAAETHVDRSIINAGEFVSTDVLGTYALLEAARKAKTERFIHISTDEVYGTIEEGSFKESDKLEPRNPYSASKGGSDLLVRSYFVTHDLPVVITRSSNNFGPYQHPEKMIPRFITNAMGDIKIPLYGDGKNVREWLYVLDNCSAIDTVLKKGEVGEVYNIGSGAEKTNLEVTKLILKIMNKPDSLIEFVKDRPGHDFRYSLDFAKIKNLGWVPKYDFNEAIKSTVKWYSENTGWWEKIKIR